MDCFAPLAMTLKQRHCEDREAQPKRDAAIQAEPPRMDCFASLATTERDSGSRGRRPRA